MLATRTALALLALACTASNAGAASVAIGSKNFPESYLLAEIAAQWLELDGHEVERRFGFGGTKIAFEALVRGDVALYPEYSGTLAATILKVDIDAADTAAINRELEPQGLVFAAPLGFNNTYAMAVRREAAEAAGWQSIDDIAAEASLTLAFSHEFMQRDDGWPGLKRRYALTQRASGIEHGLAYRALANGDIDVTDAYSTDGDIARFDLVLLTDSRGYFPRYDAAWLQRSDLAPDVVARLAELKGTLDESAMQALNARVVVDGLSFAEAANEFVAGIAPSAIGAPPRASPTLWPLVVRHIQLTLAAMLAATLTGFALALTTYKSRRLSGALLYVAGLIQTVPSIALLALMIPLLGIGFVPALVALFLYALLPVLRATLTALAAVEPVYRRVAAAMGMTSRQEFVHVLLPLALPHALAGIRTAAVISIGTATLAAFIGAGGLGEPIVTGLALNDTRMILSGAVPAALLAIGADLGFDVLERRLVPAHMRVARLPR